MEILTIALVLSSAMVPSPRLTWRERMRAQRHIRPHVNPLQRRFQQQPYHDIVKSVNFDVTRPLHLDIGCGKGHFCADLAEDRPDLNILGIEIREQLVAEAQRLQELSGSGNLRFLAGSANVLAAPCIDRLGRNGELASCSIQFPDPWPKRRHQKRRVVQRQLVTDLSARMGSGFIFIQSDVEDLACEMRSCFLDSGLFVMAPSKQLDAKGWLLDEYRPFRANTERERQAQRRKLPVWRALLHKQACI